MRGVLMTKAGPRQAPHAPGPQARETEPQCAVILLPDGTAHICSPGVATVGQILQAYPGHTVKAMADPRYPDPRCALPPHEALLPTATYHLVKASSLRKGKKTPAPVDTCPDNSSSSSSSAGGAQVRWTKPAPGTASPGSPGMLPNWGALPRLSSSPPAGQSPAQASTARGGAYPASPVRTGARKSPLRPAQEGEGPGAPGSGPDDALWLESLLASCPGARRSLDWRTQAPSPEVGSPAAAWDSASLGITRGPKPQHQAAPATTGQNKRTLTPETGGILGPSVRPLRPLCGAEAQLPAACFLSMPVLVQGQGKHKVVPSLQRTVQHKAGSPTPALSQLTPGVILSSPGYTTGTPRQRVQETECPTESLVGVIFSSPGFGDSCPRGTPVAAPNPGGGGLGEGGPAGAHRCRVVGVLGELLPGEIVSSPGFIDAPALSSLPSIPRDIKAAGRIRSTPAVGSLPASFFFSAPLGPMGLIGQSDRHELSTDLAAQLMKDTPAGSGHGGARARGGHCGSAPGVPREHIAALEELQYLQASYKQAREISQLCLQHACVGDTARSPLGMPVSSPCKPSKSIRTALLQELAEKEAKMQCSRFQRPRKHGLAVEQRAPKNPLLEELEELEEQQVGSHFFVHPADCMVVQAPAV